MDVFIPFDATQITAAILAGGAGKRVGGCDKGLMPLCGKSLVAHVHDALEGQVSSIVICINRHADRYAPFGTTLADETAGFPGPLAGIATALRACTTPWLLTLPVDCPTPAADLARRLSALMESTKRNLAVAHDGERRQPLFALYRRELANSAATALRRNSPVWRWQTECNAIEVDFSDSAISFANLNTPEEFRRWEDRHDG